MLRLQIGVTVLTSSLVTIDFTVAKINGGQIDGTLSAAWLLSLGWLFGTAAYGAWKRNGNGGNGRRNG